MQILVVGSNGFIGRHLCKHLEDKGHRVVTLSSKDKEGFDPSTGLVSDNYKVPTGTDAVFYLSQSPFTKNLPTSAPHLFQVNVSSALRIAQLSHAAGVKKLFYASTGNVYKKDFEPVAETNELNRSDWYALSKIHGEELVSMFRPKVATCCVRLFGVFGRDQTDRLVPNIISKVREGLPITLEGAAHEQATNGIRLSLTPVDGLVSVLENLLHVSNLPEVLNVSGPEHLSIRELAVMIGEKLKKSPKFIVSEKKRDGNFVCDTTLIKKIDPFSWPSVQSVIDELL